ncbi:rod shape-determining protein MreC [Desulfobulbus sp. TB]|nr:rod shape-determining protein MreC [Desulfobulbus sp. TB]
MKKNTRRQSKGSIKTFRFVLFIGTAITLVLILLIIILGDQQFGPVHKIIFEGVGPLQKTMSKISGSLHSVKKNYIELLTVREEKERLWQELQECRTKAYANRGAVALNARLKKLLDFKESSTLPTITAQIIGKDPSLWFRSVIIDRGSSDGVGKGMPVVTGEGIVGQVYASSTDYSKVLLAIAPSSAIDVLLQESRIRGILKGTGKNLYHLEYILKTAEVFVGDRVVTAGYGGMFPTELPVGIVSKVTRNRRGMFLQIEVIPAVDFRTLENLLVIERKKKEFN